MKLLKTIYFEIFYIAVVLLNDPDLHIVDIKYSSAIGGFATVMSNGRLGFITAASIKYDQNVGIKKSVLY